MVACPECLFIFDDMEDIIPAFPLPPLHIIIRYIADHIREAAGSASFAGDIVGMVHLQGIPRLTPSMQAPIPAS